MSTTREAGDRGEAMAAEYLRENGYELLASQFRCRFGEIDLIAEQEGTLLFVEVKLRTNLRYGMPRESVTAKKQEKLRSAALLYLSMHGLDAPARFDVAEVYTDVRHSARSTRIEYIENAF